MVRDLANADGAAIVTARGQQLYMSVEEIQRRAGVGRGALDRIGEADGFGSLALSRRSGLWDVKGLGNAALPLFAAADERDGKLRQEAIEPTVLLAPMGEGAEVVEDYRASGLSLRAHPLAFLRDELKARKMIKACGHLGDSFFRADRIQDWRRERHLGSTRIKRRAVGAGSPRASR